MEMSLPENKNFLVLYDLPKDSTTSVKIALNIQEKTGYVLEIKPQIRRDINRPFCTAIINIPDNEAFNKACQAMRYFEYEGKFCRGLPLENKNHQILPEQTVFITKIPKDNIHTSKWLHDFASQFGEVKSCQIYLEPDHGSRGYGKVCFQEVSSANECLNLLGNNDVVKAVKYTTLKARELFSQYGPIGMLKFAKNEMGPYCIIAYFSEDNEDRVSGHAAAQKACDDFDGKEMGGKKI